MKPKKTEVLVIEDDANIRRLLCLMLETDNYTVYEAPDGMSGLDRLRTHPTPLVVLLDWQMPGMDGIQVMSALAMEAPVTRRHCFILVTASFDSPELYRAHVSPEMCVAILGKPFDMATLLRAVARAAEQTASACATREAV